jgi:transcriptional repressor NrdR
MICIYCQNPDTEVKNSRPHKKTAHVWRRRHCPNCLQSFTTDEQPRLEAVLSITYGENSTPFNRGILITSITEAFRHDRDKGREIAWDLSETIIAQLAKQESTAVDSAKLRTICHEIIYRFDRAAGTQYAIEHHLPF